MTLTELFNRLGAPLTNPRWSWGGVRDDGTVILRVWQDRKKKFGNDWYMMLTHEEKYAENQGNLGYQERSRHVELVKAGAPCMMVMCLAEDTEALPRKIKSFNKDELFIGDRLIHSDGDWWIRLQERISVSEIDT